MILNPLNDKVAEKLKDVGDGRHRPRITGLEVGALLSYLAPKVLGQFDPFFPGPPTVTRGGRLLLVAPNIVAVERELGVDPTDFRLWVCLHEETHRVQFTAVPWLRGYLNEQIAQVVDSAELDPSASHRCSGDGMKTVMRGSQRRTSRCRSSISSRRRPRRRRSTGSRPSCHCWKVMPTS